MILEWFDLRSLLLFALIFVPLEHLLPIHEKAKMMRRGCATDLLHFFFSGVVIRIGLFLVILAAMRIGMTIVPGSWQDTLRRWPIWVQIPLVVVISDLGFYLAHRLMHVSPTLWKFHAVHHSSEELDWLASFRVHPVDQVLVKGSALLPVFALGFSELAIGVAALFYQWHALFLHSNIRIPFGPLRWIFATPEFHHWHHANEREAWDKNFSSQLPIWDILFGTAHLPGRMPTVYGVDDEVPDGYLGQLAYPFLKTQSTDPEEELTGIPTEKAVSPAE